MNKPPSFAVIQLSRVDKFSVSTFLREENGKRIIVKSPNTLESKKHLSAMEKSYKTLAALQPFASLVSPVPAKKTADGSVQFPYIKGKVVERMLLNKILARQNDEALQIIERLLKAIDSLPSSRYNPSKNADFVNVFGKSYDTEVDCIEPGLVDLNLDNIIEDEQGKWHLIDYEWVFEFPVPKKYIIQRFFYWFFVMRYQEVFRYHAERLPLVTIAPEISIPAYVHKRYQWVFEDLNRAVSAESKLLQEYVSGREDSLQSIALFDSEQLKSTVQLHLPAIKGYIAESMELVESLQAQLSETDKKNVALEQEIHGIVSSRTYRVARKLAAAKQRITKRIK